MKEEYNPQPFDKYRLLGYGSKSPMRDDPLAHLNVYKELERFELSNQKSPMTSFTLHNINTREHLNNSAAVEASSIGNLHLMTKFNK